MLHPEARFRGLLSTRGNSQAIVEIRTLLTNMRCSYISIWQLALLAGFLQGLLHYGSMLLGEPLLGGVIENIRNFHPVAASFALVREFAPLALVQCQRN